LHKTHFALIFPSRNRRNHFAETADDLPTINQSVDDLTYHKIYYEWLCTCIQNNVLVRYSTPLPATTTKRQLFLDIPCLLPSCC